LEVNLTAILKTLLYIGIFVPLLPLVFFFLFKLNSHQKTLRVILFYILYCIANEALSYYLQKIRSEYFLYFLYSVTVIEYSFFCYFIYIILPENFIKRLIPFLWAFFIIFTIIDYFLYNTGKEFDSFSIGIEAITVIVLCAYYLFSQVKGSNSLLIYSTFDFWVTITFLFYVSGTFFLYLFFDRMVKNPEFHKIYFIINISFNIMKNVLLCVAMTMRSEKSLNYRSNRQDGLPDLDDDLLIHARN
jgi:hypothetical protein